MDDRNADVKPFRRDDRIWITHRMERGVFKLTIGGAAEVTPPPEEIPEEPQPEEQ
jgi:hypothetical protein